MIAWPQERVLTEQLLGIQGSPSRLSWVVERARVIPNFPDTLRIDTNRVEGCLSKLWIQGSLSEGRCVFSCDSDSLVVKGFGALVCESCSGCLPGEIVQRRDDPPFFNTPMGSALTQNRRSGLQRLWDRILVFAEAHVADSNASP